MIINYEMNLVKGYGNICNMNYQLGELNDDQLNGLANLFLDIAKAAFILALLPIQTDSANFTFLILKIMIGLLLGLVFTYLALVLLKSKKRQKK